jgi:quercetin dioxygenase-like cupin family protein
MTNGHIGVDLIRLEAGDGFVPHTHPGDHLLIVVGGSGTITFGGRIYPTSAGEVYLIAGLVPHAVGAITEHVLLAVGAPYKPLVSPERMTPEHYEAVTTALGDLECQICHLTVTYPNKPHELDCPHCPCVDCVGTE